MPPLTNAVLRTSVGIAGIAHRAEPADAGDQSDLGFRYPVRFVGQNGVLSGGGRNARRIPGAEWAIASAFGVSGASNCGIALGHGLLTFKLLAMSNPSLRIDCGCLQLTDCQRCRQDAAGSTCFSTGYQTTAQKSVAAVRGTARNPSSIWTKDARSLEAVLDGVT